MNIIKNRYIYFLISLLVIIPGIVFMGINWQQTKAGPLQLGIDFRGGSLLEVQFEGERPTAEEISALYSDFSTEEQPIADPVVQSLGESSISIRSKAMTDETKGLIVAEMESRFGSKVTVENFTSVSASVGAEVTQAAGVAILFAAIAILIYIWWAFRSVEHAYRYGTAAILAMLHDVLVVLGVEAILGYYLGWEADALFLTALLTVIGFSVHDTIVVFDRVRENSLLLRKIEYEKMVNHSIVQTLDRSITTQLTVMFTLFALVLFGGDSIRHFVVILLIGIFSGTYSSIFNAAPILVVWENREWTTWFKPKEETAI
ncbi:MAG TPA: protein translocase subunit SecF [Anaerolineales bacterium]|nr:protein translocase subunit SecF [Anaerolineales bacterium]HMV97836.1 protein translocase subunit SecF [Anaerolineales bacterium]HMX19594.1 protein translocase subunit SecF [Anaerolineales bacterium]HMX74476.1 protein translocase subunit SecF [Anaerolineales bacterium]HMZ42922.1 protein translocase subunit SecF [Anaerolineales bacterium]